MRKLRDFLIHDLDNVFFNKDEFAEEVMIEGQLVTVIMDPELLAKKQLSSGGEALADAELLFYVQTSEISYQIDVGDNIEIKEQSYNVHSVSEDEGMYVITVGRYRT
ncbi:hypothetical protein [Niallia sp. 03190]|uniref:hypothetical protein n=1 Tax=Niallia sp. 03190 TaxID=3458061 RepID=UPI004044D1EC